MRELFDRHEVIIVGGSGGVGKTSVSAALGLLGAQAGHRTLVLTIDPARRLAGALGLSEGIGLEAADVTPRLAEAGIPCAGELHAMMLDVRNTFDRMVERYAPDEETRRRILENRLYQNISTRLSGSQEYASMQRLYEIVSEGRYDRIVLDTPPTTHALDFLTAPQRLVEFFDSRVIQLFVGFGGRVGWSLFKRGKDLFFAALERLSGQGVLREIAAFFEIAEAILEPYRTQADQAAALLRRPTTTFVVVTGPAPHQLDDAATFMDQLRQMGISVAGEVVNRWLQPRIPVEVELPELDPYTSGGAAAIAAWGLEFERFARRQTQAIERATPSEGLFRVVPILDEDVHSLEGLRAIAAALAGDDLAAT